MKQVYEFDDRVDYFVYRGKQKLQRIGYIKARRKTWFGERYYVCVADGSRGIDIVKPSQIFGLSPKKEHKQNNIN